MNVEVVRISKEGRDQLLSLKRRTGIATWNVLCRWALCMSLAEKTEPRGQKFSFENGLEIAWKTFAGEHEDAYLALLRDRCRQRVGEVTEAELNETLRQHLHRGIGYLVGDPHARGVAGLLCLAATRLRDGDRS